MLTINIIDYVVKKNFYEIIINLKTIFIHLRLIIKLENFFSFLPLDIVKKQRRGDGKRAFSKFKKS